ncbi:hypothetical protein Vi05172_g2217 [Venturia inaequalis]|nr:hypothetical protein Vi05172_g2217 [Venturia inaequalis]
MEVVTAPLVSFSVARIGGQVGLAVHARQVGLVVDELKAQDFKVQVCKSRDLRSEVRSEVHTRPADLEISA